MPFRFHAAHPGPEPIRPPLSAGHHIDRHSSIINTQKPWVRMVIDGFALRWQASTARRDVLPVLGRRRQRGRRRESSVAKGRNEGHSTIREGSYDPVCEVA